MFAAFTKFPFPPHPFGFSFFFSLPLHAPLFRPYSILIFLPFFSLAQDSLTADSIASLLLALLICAPRIHDARSALLVATRFSFLDRLWVRCLFYDGLRIFRPLAFDTPLNLLFLTPAPALVYSRLTIAFGSTKFWTLSVCILLSRRNCGFLRTLIVRFAIYDRLIPQWHIALGTIAIETRPTWHGCPGSFVDIKLKISAVSIGGMRYCRI